MPVLAIDTSNKTLSVAIVKDEERLLNKQFQTLYNIVSN